MATVKASNHMERVASVGCILCRQLGYDYVPAQVHHIFSTAERSPFLTIPLCPEHHKGGTGFHGLGEREFNRRYKTSEAHLLAQTLERLA
jgi:hypothetical protein